MFTFKSSVVVVALVVSTFSLPVPSTGAKSFTLQNGKDAVALNNKFQSLTASSACTDGEDACVGGQFAQCANGKFALTSCGTGTVCAALPLVNSAGTSVTCTTDADRDARIAATGASGAASGAAAANSGAVNAAAAPSSAAAATPAAPATSAAAGAKSFTLQNGKDAIALNNKFQSLTASSACTDGENACVGDQFAQCANGKFALTSCGAGTVCAALPLVNSAGTSVTCTTNADKDARIAATGN